MSPNKDPVMFRRGGQSEKEWKLSRKQDEATSPSPKISMPMRERLVRR